MQHCTCQLRKIPKFKLSGLHASYRTSSRFSELCLQGKYCDAVIRVEDVDYKIHKFVLCDSSPYFSPFFSPRWNADTMVFDIHGLSPDIMQLIIEFAYSGSVLVTKDNAEEVTLAADMLNVQGVVQACSNFFGEQLCPENCIGIWQFTHFFFHPDLQRKACHYITEHFDEVVPCEEFLQLSLQELADILGRDELNMRNESNVFEAILRWISHKHEEREKHMTVLFSKFRMALTSTAYIYMDVMTNELVKNTECQKMISNALQLIQYMKEEPSCALRNPLARPRLPSAILLAIVGCTHKNQSGGIVAYDAGVDRWIKVANTLGHPWKSHSTAFLGGNVYTVGGFEGLLCHNTVTRFNLSTRTWHEVSPMYHRRGDLSATVLNGYIYAIGGFDGLIKLSSAERYRPIDDEWEGIAPMCQPRSQASCTTLHNKIYICGGYDGREILQTAECYNPETNQWIMIAPMIQRRCGHGVIAHAGCVYAVGGHVDYYTFLSSAEFYDPKDNRWQLLSSMWTIRSSFGLGVINERIYAVGGRSLLRSTRRVEYYDRTVDQWIQACNIEKPSSKLSCCVVSGIPNMAEYAVPRDSLPFVLLEERTLASRDSDFRVSSQQTSAVFLRCFDTFLNSSLKFALWSFFKKVRSSFFFLLGVVGHLASLTVLDQSVNN
ncbi:kelch-like protein 10 [Solea solea]|uniref:kelch-like protein 10 n=1 Tax=Solea solea TaxID=90069 RepID=UPI00272C6CBE|nr:kelch-like protein 10 [Solea solea]